ncbi:uncharacterized protein LOC111321957 [Stylophora pistillata]|uniref:Uncharacterized protein n=1 Tax=Stylophora pistillata TaxID=50429 RepID=A0A2B4SSY2_STYPI|nr:uncharacterized protein LOC111321957 [Stylophora pistillata]PFX31597.1 hypothetical protein AWC38_SpisGene3639 [Stylophora pistillata]
MVLRQCLACNILITESSRSCVCGHVLEDAHRFIGGKRFSEYRAKLYSRLEGKRKKRELREIKEQVKPLEERKNIMAGSVSEQPKFKLPVKRKPLVARTTNKKRRTKRRTPRLQKGQSTIKRNDSKSSVPPELLSRLPAALQEINRRILVQNFLWLALQLD